MKKHLVILLLFISSLLVFVSCNDAVTPGGPSVDPKLTTPLSLEFREAGSLYAYEFQPGGTCDIQYSLDGKYQADLPYLSIDNENPIAVPAGTTVTLFGNYGSTKKANNVSISTDVNCYVYGNVMSLIDPVNFATADTVYEKSFYNLFALSTNIYNHETKDIYLPATNLAENCYDSMFSWSKNITRAPELPAKKLVPNCYYHMFRCSDKLNYVKCLATDISASSCLTDWLDDVSATGTFVKDPAMNNWPEGGSGIPASWTIQNN